MEKKPNLSVIIPTFNRAHLLSKAIKSVLDQTYKDFEIFVIDDCSTDKTSDVVKSFKNKKIKYLVHKENQGGSAARNTGIKAAKGDFITFLDDDDELFPRKFEKQITKFHNLSEDFGVVYSGYCIIKSKKKWQFYPEYRKEVYSVLLKRNILGSSTPMVRKNCFKIAGLFDENLPSCQDWDMWIRLSKYFMFDFVQEILSKHNIHGNQISTNLEKKIIGRRKLIKKHYADLSKNPVIYSKHLKRLGVLSCLSGDFWGGRKYFLSSIRHYPIQKGSLFNLFLSFVPTIYKKRLGRTVEDFNGTRVYW
jgi:glycosyltransferase involved in cell wall biosynthesis